MASFEKLQVYQRAIDFSYKIYRLTENWPKTETFGLTSQLRRAAVSISLNIAEGSSRSRKDFSHFLTISGGSCYECIPLLAIATKLKYLTNEDYKTCYTEVEALAKMINGLRNSLDL